MASAKSDYEKYKNYLYSSERLEFRSKIFLELSCPQLEVASQSHELIHVVSFSDSLPKEYKDRLYAAAERWSFLLLDEQNDNSAPFDPFQFARVDALTSSMVGLYRVDDDDILSASYFDWMERYLRPEYAGMQVSLARGLTGVWDSGSISPLREFRSPLIAAGLMSICSFDDVGDLIAPKPSAHDQADRVNPVILDSRPLAYLHIRHSGQDTSLKLDTNELVTRLRRSVLSSPAIKDVKEAKKEFHAVLSYLNFDDSTELFTRPTVLKDEICTSFPNRAQTFELQTEIQAGETADKLNVVVSLDLVHADGTHVRYEESVEGIAKSGDPAIGFYFIPRIKPGRNMTLGKIALPEGIFCKGVRFIRRPRNDASLSLTSCIITVFS